MKNFLFVFAVCLVAISCSKKDDSPSDTDLLVQSSWKLNTVGFDADRNGTADIPYPIPACLQDDSFTFSKNGTGTDDNGATKCTEDSPQTVAFSWSLSGKTINANIPNLFSGNAALKTLTTSSMIIWKDTTLASIPGTLIVEFKH